MDRVFINLGKCITQGNFQKRYPYLCLTLVRLLRHLNTLSFDTALGAVSCVLVVGYALQIEINYSIYAALFISVLSIYNIDHLLDAIKLNGGAKSVRHAYYQKNSKALFFWQFILLAIGVVVIFYIPIKIFWVGVALLFSIAIYFLIIFRFTKTNLFLREVIVALGYTVAVCFVPIVSSDVYLSTNYFWLVAIMFLIALSNLWVFSIYDIKMDKNQKHHSMARNLNVSFMKNLVRGLVILTFLTTFGFAIYYKLWLIGSVLFFVEFIYLLLLEKQEYFHKNEKYRLVGEYILILPGAILLIYHAV